MGKTRRGPCLWAATSGGELTAQSTYPSHEYVKEPVSRSGPTEHRNKRGIVSGGAVAGQKEGAGGEMNVILFQRPSDGWSRALLARHSHRGSVERGMARTSLVGVYAIIAARVLR